MKVGDLVQVRQDISEYVEMMGQRIGLVVEVGLEYDGVNVTTSPELVHVFWPEEGEIERYYADEVQAL